MFKSFKKSAATKKLRRNELITNIIMTGIADSEISKTGITNPSEMTEDIKLSAQAINYLLAKNVDPLYANNEVVLKTRAEQILSQYKGLGLLINYTLTDRAQWLKLVYTDNELVNLPGFSRLVEELKEGKELYPNAWTQEDFEKLLDNFAERYNPDMRKHVKPLFTV